MKSFESITEMNVETPTSGDNCNQYGIDTVPIRVLAAGGQWPSGGAGWVLVRQVLDSTRDGLRFPGDCLLIESGDLAVISVDELQRVGLPVVAAMTDDSDTIDAALVDIADGFVLAGDDAAVMAAVFERTVAGAPGMFDRASAGAPAMQLRELSDGTARTINALSAETSRIADALARLAAAQRAGGADAQPVDAALVRRLLRVRRERERFFPAEIFADPAWDMLLDLTAARMEGKTVPVSSLCIAAAVPTTTALRWIRSLTEAGLFERRIDPSDGRRTYVGLSEAASEAMMGYLRVFGGVFAGR